MTREEIKEALKQVVAEQAQEYGEDTVENLDVDTMANQLIFRQNIGWTVVTDRDRVGTSIIYAENPEHTLQFYPVEQGGGIEVTIGKGIQPIDYPI